MKAITEKLSSLFGQAFAASGYDEVYGEVVPSNRPDLSDFQCNGALPAASEYQKNPREIAQQVVDALDPQTREETFSEISLAGPGFINIRLSDRFLAQHIGEMSQDERLGVPLVRRPRNVVLDFGGANVAKRMHIGHLRPTIIGDSLQRLFRFRGDNVVSDIHMGDWGLQMGMLIKEIEHRQPDLPYFDADYTGPYPEESPVDMDDLQEIYPAASERTKTDPEALEAARLATKDLQDGRPGYRALWQHIVDVSIEALKEDFERLDVTFDLWMGEADAHPRIEPMVRRLVEQGYAQESAGAIIIEVDEPDDKADIPPLMLLKSDGSVLYGTTDLATIEQRVEELKAEFIGYVVDIRQSLHFEQVFRAARKTGIAPAGEVDLEHLPNGTINGPDGKPFKTRAGGVPTLKEVIDMVVDKARERLEEIEAAQSYDEEERERIAEQVGIAALKFGDLVNHRAKDYVFDLERFTSFEGRTGPYMLYAAVRTKSIMRRAVEEGLRGGDIIPPASSEERDLMLKLSELPNVVAHAYETRAPNHLADYVYNLAITFNRFYREHHILSEKDAAQQASWLALSQCTLRQIECVLSLLGIEVPERM
ncbi:MAG TPA: arginine--tRNA ligase [Candidatus Sulfomarinibacteraceae bacterium]|nr:arginine--tRNA ligase [Candidatus Sulfomarinibacteraceae bacterium]